MCVFASAYCNLSVFRSRFLMAGSINTAFLTGCCTLFYGNRSCSKQASCFPTLAGSSAQAEGNFTLKSSNKFIALVVAVFLLIIVLALASVQIFRQIETTAEARKQATDVMIRTTALLGDLVDAETGQRGYMVTGDEAFLQPYLAVRDVIHERLNALRALVPAGAAQNHLNAVAPLMEAKLAHILRSIESRRGNNVSAVIADSTIGKGKQLMDSIRVELGSVVESEQALVAQYEIEIQSGMRHLFALIISACLFTLLLAVFFAYLIYRESQQQSKNLLHRETEQLLANQLETNITLQQTNFNLHVSEQKLAITLNSIDDAVIATDVEGRVTLMNPLAERLIGWTQAEAFNRPVDEIFHIIHAKTREPYPVPVKETLKYGTTRGLANHTKVIARDGSECDIADSCAPIRDRGGQVVGAVLVFRDVTERIRLDKILNDKNTELEAARAAADKANLAKSEFLSSMSHELRTPLSAILGFAQLIETGVPLPTPLQKRSVEQILKAGWYLLDLINEILDLALIESGKLSLSMEPISLIEVVHECQTMIERQAQARGVSVTFQHLECGVFIQADRTRVKQALINLLSNAIKYSAVGGTVAVECSMNTPQRVRVSVKDAGAGLTPAQIAQLFQPFNRLGRESTDDEGTGIGLVMTKRLVELMGGVICVESTPGKGSVFLIELNVTSAPKPAVLAMPHSGVAVAPNGVPVRTVLYVEDNPANMMLVEDIIARRPDLRLLGARDGVTGIQMAIASLPDVILMDINLPGISGIEALRILMGNPVTAHIPIVALSANAMPRDIEKGLEAGFFRYLTKPIKVNEFIGTLDVALQFAQTGKSAAIPQETA